MEGSKGTAVLYPSTHSQPTACRHSKSPAENPSPRAKRGNNICGCPLENIETASVSSCSRLIEAQKHIDAILTGAPQVALGQEVSSLTYLRDLRSLCKMLLIIGLPENIGDVSPEVRAAFASYVRAKEKNFIGRKWRVPESPALMAAVIPPAIDMLRLPS